jgi:hypothetical protein
MNIGFLPARIAFPPLWPREQRPECRETYYRFARQAAAGGAKLGRSGREPAGSEPGGGRVEERHSANLQMSSDWRESMRLAMAQVPAPSHHTQLYVVKLLTDWTLREIENLFGGHELTQTVETLDEDRWPVGSSVRRDTAARYHAALDLSNPLVRARLLRVYDELLAQLPDSSELRRYLKRDGVEFDDEGAIEPAMMRLPDASLSSLADVTDAPWEAGVFRLFVSHTSANRERGAGLRSVLAAWGVDAFVAHDAIEPTREWQNVIEAALLTCDALCAIVTPDFVESRWCDQEVGFAMARRIVVVPIKADADPHGFIGKYQAVATTGASMRIVAERLFEALARSPSTANRMAPAIVRRYEKSDTLENTVASFPLMATISKSEWTPAMIEQVERAAIENPMVNRAKLPGGRRVTDAVAELLRSVRGTTATMTAADDDIPF